MLAVTSNSLWYVFPLIGSISLVYSASRYELPERIIRRSLNLVLTISGFMLIVLVILWALSSGL